MRIHRGLFPAVLLVILLPITVVAAPVPSSRPTPPTVVAVSAGASGSCALTSGGAVKCWGERVDDVYLEPNSVPGLDSGVQAIATGWSHSCALRAGGMKCWGDNLAGQLGDGTTKSRHDPVTVVGLDGEVVAISASGDSTCAVTAKGGVRCWGENGHGQLGDGTTRNRHVPTKVVGLNQPVIDIASGSSSTCAILEDGSVRCWGENAHGQLGDGTTRDRLTPTPVQGLPHRATDVTVGADHSCAVVPRTGVLCWGGNGKGQLGDGTTSPSLTPTRVIDLVSGRPAIEAGDRSTCALRPPGLVECWGWNHRGMLGDGTDVDRRAPTPVLGLGHDVVDLAVGDSHSCVATADGAARCWGENNGSQIGDGTYENARYVPMTVWGLTGTLSHTYRPDLLIARHRDGPYRGDGVYNGNGEGQTRQFVAVRGRPVTFFVRLQTDGDARDIAYVEGHAWYRWQYPILEPRYYRGGEDISRAVEFGLYWKRIRVDGLTTIRVVVKAHPNLVPRRGESFKISMLSSHDPMRRDAVRIKVVRPA